jgi:hypothetical protein
MSFPARNDLQARFACSRPSGDAKCQPSIGTRGKLHRTRRTQTGDVLLTVMLNVGKVELFAITGTKPESNPGSPPASPATQGLENVDCVAV